MEPVFLKKLKPILLTTYPKLKPHECVSENAECKAALKCNLFQSWWDLPIDNQQYEWIQATQFLKETDEYLKRLRRDAIVKFGENDTQWTKIRDEFLSIRDYFVSQESFLKENEEKRQRARRKIVEERQLCFERTQKLLELKEQYELVWSVKLKIEEELKLFRIYEDFLNHVVFTSSGQFKEVASVMSRYESLVDNRETISELRARRINEIYSLQKKMADITESKILQVLALNSKTVELISRNDVAKSSVLHWETVVAEIRKLMEEKHSQQDSIIVCIRNLFNQMCRRKNMNPKKLSQDLAFQIMFIKKTLFGLRKAEQMAEKLALNNLMMEKARFKVVKEKPKPKRSVKDLVKNKLSKPSFAIDKTEVMSDESSSINRTSIVSNDAKKTPPGLD